MPSYRFAGSAGAIMDTPHTFERFGQKAEIDEALAAEKIAEGFPLLLASEFDACGLTEKELADYPSAESHEAAPEAFREKKNTVLMKLHELRESLRNPADPEASLKTSESGLAPEVSPSRES